jgi:predicted nucleic acid-binding protein
LTFDETLRRLRAIERITTVLPDLPSVVRHWKELVVLHKVQGVQVHDTRLVATMDAYGVVRILTLNTSDFLRFGHITAMTPEDVLA